MQKPNILFADIETAPILADVWGLWMNNVSLNQINRDWYVLSWAAKWADSKEVMCDALPMHPAVYANDKEDDYSICLSLWEMLDKADIVVGHNGDRFDWPKMNARFIKHGMLPPSPYKTVDTLKIAKASFKFTSNKLDFLGTHLQVGRKIKHQGHELWTGCMQGDNECWAGMIKYNKQDVLLLEAVYYKLLPWAKNHPNMGLYHDEEEATCPKCNSTDLHYRGYAYSPLGKFHRFQCQVCGGWGRDKTTTLTKEKRKALRVHA